MHIENRLFNGNGFVYIPRIACLMFIVLFKIITVVFVFHSFKGLTVAFSKKFFFKLQVT